MAIDLNTRLLGGGFDRPLTRTGDNWLSADRRAGLGGTSSALGGNYRAGSIGGTSRGSEALGGNNRQQTTYDAQGRVLSADAGDGSQRMTDQYRLGYQAHAGDSLERIAETVWGDKSLWYLLAEANDLQLGATDSLGTDQLLKVPFVADSQGGIHAFDTDAVLVADITKPAEIPAPPANKLSWLSILLQVVVTVVVVVAVSALTAGLGTVAAGIIGGAVGAVVGDVVGQTAAMAFNNRLSWDNYDLKRTLIAGAVGAIGGALSSGSSALNAVVADKGLLARMAFVAVKDTSLGAATNSVEQGIRMASGQQDHFDVGQLAASAIAGVVDGGYGIAHDATRAVGSSVSRGLASAAGDVIWDMGYGFSRNLFGDMMTKGINTGDFSLDLDSLEISAAASIGRSLGSGIGQRIRADLRQGAAQRQSDQHADDSWEWVSEARSTPLPASTEFGEPIVPSSVFSDIDLEDSYSFRPAHAEVVKPAGLVFVDVPRNDGEGEVFRGDSRGPDQVFKHGFQINQDDWRDWKINTEDSVTHTPAIRDMNMAMAQAKRSGASYLYTIANRADAKTLRTRVKAGDERLHTLIFPGGIAGEEVIGVHQVINGVTGPLQVNLGFKGLPSIKADVVRQEVSVQGSRVQNGSVQKAGTSQADTGYQRVQPNDGIGLVFRNDVRGPDEIFGRGFQAGQDQALRLRLPAAQADSSSLATRSLSSAVNQAGRSGVSYLYSICNRKDAGMLKAMAKASDIHGEDMHFPRGIAGEEVVGVREIRNGVLGPLRINKDFNRSASVVRPFSGPYAVLDETAANMPSAENARMLYRGEPRAPAEIFRNGFRSTGEVRDLARYYAGKVPSVHVSTSKHFDVSHNFVKADGRSYIYLIREQAHGIDANETGLTSYDHEHEITFPGGIGASHIYGVLPVIKDSIGPLMHNPYYKTEE